MSRDKTSKEYLNRVAQLPCATCGCHGVEIHHVREGQGMGQRAGDFLVVPLCPQCHRGTKGVHGDKSMQRILKKTDLDLVNDTFKQVFSQMIG